MYTQCPQCLTYFQVTPEHLRIAQGNVRCGQCRNVFSALGNLTEEPPQVSYNEEDELEEEIFIDEEELEEYADEYSEEYTEEYAEEYPEEFYITDEEIDEEPEEEFADDEPPQQPAPIDLERTNIIPPSKQPNANPPPEGIPAPTHALPNSHKLNEAIATIEKLRKSYSNLSIRQLESRGPLPGTTAANHTPAPVTPPEPEPPAEDSIPEEPTGADIQESAPSEPATPPPVAEPAEVPQTVPDVALQHSPDEDDGVDYEEALNALNELKIIEEDAEEATEEDAANAISEHIELQEPVQAEDELADFQNDLSIDESDIVGNGQALFDNQTLREEILESDSEEGVKVKSLDRKARETTATTSATAAEHIPDGHIPTGQPEKKSRAGKKTRKKAKKDKILRGKFGNKRKKKQDTKEKHPPATVDEQQESPKFLPAIPKQLLDDFHPGHDQAPQHLLSMTLWSLGSIALMLVFLVQTVYFKHNDLARVPQLRPWIESFCGYMECELKLPSDVRQLELVSQDIRSHPRVKSALLVTTTIINNAGFVQSYPGLQITFSDLNGQHVAMRRFAPHEYLSADINKEAGMPPNTPIQVELEMMDPGSNAVNFEFDFIPLT
jgi:predicted Zn finger-like uncharacterized protein